MSHTFNTQSTTPSPGVMNNKNHDSTPKQNGLDVLAAVAVVTEPELSLFSQSATVTTATNIETLSSPPRLIVNMLRLTPDHFSCRFPFRHAINTRRYRSRAR